MDTILFLEKLATNVHHSEEMKTLTSQQAHAVRTAVYKNDGAELKRIISPTTSYYADKTGVVRA